MKKVFWDLRKSRTQTPYVGGCYYRSEVSDFIKKLEDTGKVVVGVVIDDSYNIEFICDEEWEEE